MLSAIVIAADASAPSAASPEAIVRTLGSLVPGAIDGLVRDVVVAAAENSDDLRRIADHAGCELAIAARPDATIAAAIAMARGDLLLILRAGRAPEVGFLEELAAIFGGGPGSRPAAATLRATPDGFVSRLIPTFAPVAGLVAERSRVAAGAADLAALVARARPSMTLRTRLRRAG